MNKADAENLIKEYGKSLYSFCLYCTRSKEAADELYQETFLVALEKDEVAMEQNPKSYLITIAANLWRNRMRKMAWRKRIAEVTYPGEEELGQIADGGGSVEDEVIRRQEEERVRACVLTLPEKHRIVILMYYMEEMSIEDIALALGIPEGTVKSRMNKARKILKEGMNSER